MHQLWHTWLVSVWSVRCVSAHYRTIIRDCVPLAVKQNTSWFMVVIRLSEFHALHLCFHWFIVVLATLSVCSFVVDRCKITYNNIRIRNFLGVRTFSLNVRRCYMLLLQNCWRGFTLQFILFCFTARNTQSLMIVRRCTETRRND